MYNIITQVFLGGKWQVTDRLATADSLNEARAEARECISTETLYSRSTYGEFKRFRAIIAETGEVVY